MWLVVGGLASLVVPWLGWAWAASVALYASVLLGAGLFLGRSQPRAIQARIPVIFTGIHLGFAWGFLKEVAKQATTRVQSRAKTPPRWTRHKGHAPRRTPFFLRATATTRPKPTG